METIKDLQECTTTNDLLVIFKNHEEILESLNQIKELKKTILALNFPTQSDSFSRFTTTIINTLKTKISSINIENSSQEDITNVKKIIESIITKFKLQSLFGTSHS